MNEVQPQGEVLILGASGLVGTQAANAFIKAGWKVHASSRRFPELIDAGSFRHLSLDLMNPADCEAAVEELSAVTHVVYTAVYELPGLMPGWSDPEQIATNGRMLENILAPLVEAANLEHVTLLQGTKAYGAAVQPMRVPGRESQPRVEHPNFYWVQEDYLKTLSATRNFGYTILRPQLIVGPNHGVVMNLPPVVGAYAAIRKYEGLPLSYPGGADWVWEAADARIVGNACFWAGTNTAARNETFNITNGEVFSWRDMWPALAAVLDIEVGPDEPIDMPAYLVERAELWPAIVQQHNLQPLSLAEILGESHHYANLCFAYGAEQSPAPAFLSTVKVKQAGFTETMNSEASFCHWLRDLRRRKVIP